MVSQYGEEREGKWEKRKERKDGGEGKWEIEKERTGKKLKYCGVGVKMDWGE